MSTLANFCEPLMAAGARPQHRDRLLRAWVQGRPLAAGRQLLDDVLPKPVRAVLPTWWSALEGLAGVDSVHPGEDGSERLLVKLADGQRVESVLLPRQGLCVSTQVGCAVGCQFCMTGQSGLLRQLSAPEILAQVALARRRRPVRKVVFMGMGEPAHNLEAVLEAIELLGTLGNIGHKNLVFSTVGDPRAFERLGQGRVKPALALSLHTTRAELRERLLPRAPRLSPQELVAQADAYGRRTGYPVQYQWTLMEGVNDGPEEWAAVIDLFKGRYGVLNLIPYNQVEGLPFARPDAEKAAEIARHLHRHGVLTKLRQSAGQDVDGGCGQLRARAEGGATQVLRPPRPRVPKALPIRVGDKPQGLS